MNIQSLSERVVEMLEIVEQAKKELSPEAQGVFIKSLAMGFAELDAYEGTHVAKPVFSISAVERSNYLVDLENLLFWLTVRGGEIGAPDIAEKTQAMLDRLTTLWTIPHIVYEEDMKDDALVISRPYLLKVIAGILKSNGPLPVNPPELAQALVGCGVIRWLYQDKHIMIDTEENYEKLSAMVKFIESKPEEFLWTLKPAYDEQGKLVTYSIEMIESA